MYEAYSMLSHTLVLAYLRIYQVFNNVVKYIQMDITEMWV